MCQSRNFPIVVPSQLNETMLSATCDDTVWCELTTIQNTFGERCPGAMLGREWKLEDAVFESIAGYRLGGSSLSFILDIDAIGIFNVPGGYLGYYLAYLAYLVGVVRFSPAVCVSWWLCSPAAVCQRYLVGLVRCKCLALLSGANARSYLL